MLITDKNFEAEFKNQRRIAIPRGEVAITFILHSLILFICHLLCYNVLSVFALFLFALELIYGLRIMFKIWVRLGYSVVLFFVFQAVYFVVCALLAEIVRSYIINAF